MSRKSHTGSRFPRRIPVFAISALLLAGALLSSCSSAPDPPEAVYDTKNQASRYAEYGNAHLNDAEYDLALRFFELALDENTTVDNQPGIASNHNSIGRVYLAVGRTEAAESNFRRALSVADRHDLPAQRAQARSNLAELYLYQDDTGAALEQLEAALAIVREAELDEDPIILHNLAVVRMRQDSLDEAETLLRRALELNESERAWAEAASNHYMLAAVASRRDRSDEAIAAAQRALARDKQAENAPGIAKDLYMLGVLHRRAGKGAEAYDYLQRALRVTVALNQYEESLRNLRRLVEVAREVGDEDAAAEYQRQLELLEEEEEAFVSGS